MALSSPARSWTRALGIGAALLVALSACRKPVTLALDASLPDGEVAALQPADVVLEGAADGEDPALRAPALDWLCRARPDDEVMAWGIRGTFDADPWVQRRVTLALLERLDAPGVRELLIDYVARRTGDPYVRASVAHALLDRGLGDRLVALEEAWRGLPTWQAAPLALAASRRGQAPALEPLRQALSQADLRDEHGFLVEVGRYGPAELVAALEKGATWAEEELGTPLAFARGLLGDGRGETAWIRAIRSRDAQEAREAFDLVLQLPPEERGRWADAARRARDPAVSTLARAITTPGVLHLRRASGSPVDHARATVPRLLVERGEAEGTSILVELLADDDPAVRRAAAEAVGRLCPPQAVAALADVRVDDRARLRVEAAGAWAACRP